MKFLENLTKLMEQKNINRSELAREIDIAPSTVNSWYNRSFENISLKTLLKLSKFFNKTIEELVHGNTNVITFTEKRFTKAELNAIINFSEFLIDNRIEERKIDKFDIRPFSELEKISKYKHYDVG